MSRSFLFNLSSIAPLIVFGMILQSCDSKTPKNHLAAEKKQEVAYPKIDAAPLVVEVFSQPNFQGVSMKLSPGEYSGNLGSLTVSQIKSVKLPLGLGIRVTKPNERSEDRPYQAPGDVNVDYSFKNNLKIYTYSRYYLVRSDADWDIMKFKATIPPGYQPHYWESTRQGNAREAQWTCSISGNIFSGQLKLAGGRYIGIDVICSPAVLSPLMTEHINSLEKMARKK